MARIKYGGIIAQAAGSVGGMTFQRCSYGDVMRSKPLPIHSRTINQLNRRAILHEIQSSWTVLSDADRLKWSQFVQYSGQTINHDSGVLIGGYSLYLKYQFCRRLYHIDLLSDFTYVPIPEWPTNFIVNAASGQLYVQFDRVIESDEYFFVMFLSNPRIPSKSYSPTNCRFQYCPITTSNVFVFTASYIDNFGILANVGDTLHFSIYYFSTIAPLLSGFSTGKLIVGQQFPNIDIPIPPIIPPTENLIVIPNLSGFSGIAANANIFVAITESVGGINYATSPDGIEWTARASGFDMIMKAIVWSGTYFLAVGDCANDPHIYRSVDGINWTGMIVGQYDDYTAAALAGDYVVAISNAPALHVIQINAQGFIFPLQAIPPAKTYTGIAYGLYLFVIVSNSPGSPDCFYLNNNEEWAVCNLNFFVNWTCVCFGNEIFVAGNTNANGHNFAMSQDGVNWTVSNNTAFGAIYAIAYHDGRFVAVGQGTNGNAIFESTDGLNWLKTDILTASKFTGVCWKTDKFVAVNEVPGTVMYFD